MGMFKTEQTLPYSSSDLAAVAEQVKDVFRAEGYDATGHETPDGGQFISLTKGDTAFKSVLGLKTALNVHLNPTPQGTHVKAEVGTYGEAILGTALAWFVFWPISAVQVWGALQNSKTDERVLMEIEKALKAHAEGAPEGTAANGAAETAQA
ncbi:MAG: hypothetical protein HKN04_03120 [Rhodothermaceae bacterium]|nr:hypothetical protein [Rhodothermaceae bacterium]